MRRICKMLSETFFQTFFRTFWGFSAPAEPEKAKEANNPLRFETEGIVVDRAPGPRPNVTVFCAGSGEGGAVFSAGNWFHCTRVRLECQFSENPGECPNAQVVRRRSRALQEAVHFADRDPERRGAVSPPDSPRREFRCGAGAVRIPGAFFCADNPSAAEGERNPGASGPGVS